MDGKICLVTGGTSGIGKEIVAGLVKLGAEVVFIGRNEAKCKLTVNEISNTKSISANKNKSNLVSYITADLSSQKAIHQVADSFISRYNHLDVLVNNAGTFRTRRELTEDGIEYTLAVNHLAPFLLTSLLIDVLKKSAPSKVITTSSIAHRGARINFEDINLSKSFSGWRAYGQSKLANILFTYELSRRLISYQVCANCFHPGAVRTNLANGNPFIYRFIWAAAGPFLLKPVKGAETGLYLASTSEMNSCGKYYVKKKPVLSSSLSYDRDMASRLWQLSEEMTGISSDTK